MLRISSRIPLFAATAATVLLLAAPAMAADANAGIIVQGGRDTIDNGTGAVSIGPKQDDPRAQGGEGTLSIGPKQDDPRASGGTGVLSIGPKQDDPRTGDGTGVLSIGPKQDDPLIVQGGREAAGEDDGTAGNEDKPGIIVQGGKKIKAGKKGVLSIGPKQDDPRAVKGAGTRSIGPKQDDPRGIIVQGGRTSSGEDDGTAGSTGNKPGGITRGEPASDPVDDISGPSTDMIGSPGGFQ